MYERKKNEKRMKKEKKRNRSFFIARVKAGKGQPTRSGSAIKNAPDQGCIG
jgi:hypothetical protein